MIGAVVVVVDVELGVGGMVGGSGVVVVVVGSGGGSAPVGPAFAGVGPDDGAAVPVGAGGRVVGEAAASAVVGVSGGATGRGRGCVPAVAGAVVVAVVRGNWPTLTAFGAVVVDVAAARSALDALGASCAGRVRNTASATRRVAPAAIAAFDNGSSDARERRMSLRMRSTENPFPDGR
jgi:hypothetical protein